MREAQVCSSPGAVGRQAKIFRRLVGVGHAGHPRRPDDGHVLQVRQRRDAERHADLRVGQRVIDRRNQIVDRALEALQERGGDTMGAGADVNGRRLERHPARHVGHPRVDVDQRHALAVDRHFHLLAGGRSAEQEPAGVAVQLEAQAVVAIGRERVDHGDGRRACRSARRRPAPSARRSSARGTAPPTDSASGSPMASDVTRLAARR